MFNAVECSILLLSFNFFYSSSSCCWIEGMTSNSNSSWNVEAVISLKKRGPNVMHSPNRVNTPPPIYYVPLIQHNVFQPKTYTLPVPRQIGLDKIKCRWAASFKEGGGIWNNRVGTLLKEVSYVILR